VKEPEPVPVDTPPMQHVPVYDFNQAAIHPADEVEEKEFFSLNRNFEVEMFALVEHLPEEGFNQILFGENGDFVMTAKDHRAGNHRMLVWYVGSRKLPIAGTSRGVRILGLAYGGHNTILAVIENQFNVKKVYKVNGLVRPALTSRFGVRIRQDHELRNPLVEGRRVNGDRRTGIERRAGFDRRSGRERRQGKGNWLGEERRSGIDRRVAEERRSGYDRRSGFDRRRQSLEGRRTITVVQE
jgi:hypothetical protein